MSPFGRQPFPKKFLSGVRGADPDRAQWAKQRGGSPLSKEAPKALANRCDHCEVRTRPSVPLNASPQHRFYSTVNTTEEASGDTAPSAVRARTSSLNVPGCAAS